MPQGDVLEDDLPVSAAGHGDRTQEQQQQFSTGRSCRELPSEFNASTTGGQGSGEQPVTLAVFAETCGNLIQLYQPA